jgi:thiol-disulfide isomerase/thioredoxin
MLLLAKNQSATSTLPSNMSPEAQYDQYIKQGKPTFAFFHSTNCDTCIEMMGIVAQIYPEFKEHVALVDTDVYDAQNSNLLRRFNIRSIPTQVFIDRHGQKKVVIGVISTVQLRQYLQILKETP